MNADEFNVAVVPSLCAPISISFAWYVGTYYVMCKVVTNTCFM